MIEAGSDRCKLARVDSPDCAVRQPIITNNFIISNLSVKKFYFIISFLSVEKSLILGANESLTLVLRESGVWAFARKNIFSAPLGFTESVRRHF